MWTSGESAVSDEPIAFSECQVVLPLFTHFLSVAQYISWRGSGNVRRPSGY